MDNLNVKAQNNIALKAAQSQAKDDGKNLVGAVMVVGGGIAGIQASLDLAEAGYKVYLVEKKSAIGGRMARLDKTFPTNDCAMCIVSPKLVDCGRHLNIEIITEAEVESIQGEAGNFQVTLDKKASYIDPEECTACGDCAEVCPVEIKDEFNEGFNNRKAAYKLYPQAIPSNYNIEKKGLPPCREACPAGCNVQGYTALIREEKFAEALQVIRRDIPFPSICGRICHHPCEEACNRQDFDEPIAAASLKRAAADYGWTDEPLFELESDKEKEEEIAIVGAGPAGLTAALDLRAAGYQVKVFAREEEPGGTLYTALPGYRLDPEVLRQDIDYILSHGIEFQGETEVGQDVSWQELKDNYDALLLATGATKARSLDLPNSDLAGIMEGLDFIKAAKENYCNKKENFSSLPEVEGAQVLVIGGGNVAIDAARTAIREGASQVQLACLESQEEMPAHQWEIEEALAEGVVINTSLGPRRFIPGEDNQVVGVEFWETIAVFDEEGNFAPQYDKSSTEIISADLVLTAIGQEPEELGIVGDGIAARANNTIKADETTLATGEEGVFAAGEIITGPSSVVEAIASGQQAALSLQRYLSGEDLKAGREPDLKDDLPAPEAAVTCEPRISPATATPEERCQDYREVISGYSQEEAIAEAERCLDCAICSECWQCIDKCEPDCIDHTKKDEKPAYNVGAVIFSTGSELVSPTDLSDYEYDRWDNMLTSLEYERILSASGPFAGEIMRPSDRQHPGRIAFVQCAGSRDISQDNNYCSAVCCMYTIKQALITLEHQENVEIDIYYIDIRSHGKDFERYYNRAQARPEINFIRSRVSGVEKGDSPGNIRLKATSGEGPSVRREYDLVILASGLKAEEKMSQQLQDLQIRTNKYGFAASDEFAPVATGKRGIYTCGLLKGPKDIPETVTEASGAAAEAAGLLAPARNTLTREKEYPEEKELGEEIRVGVFICHCGINIGSVIDVPEVVAAASELKEVELAAENLYTCSQDSLDEIKEQIKEKDLNRVVVASCTPRTHEPLYQDTVREAGLNPYLFEMTNIREQASWVHQQQPQAATEKAKDLVKMAVNRVKKKEPVYTSSFTINQQALIIGGGVAGLTSALELAQLGFPVFLIEKEQQLGGQARKLSRTPADRPIRYHLEKLKSQVLNHELIEVHYGQKIADISGFVGNYQLKLKPSASDSSQNDLAEQQTRREIEAGIIIVATGAREAEPEEYNYKESERVITQLELEELFTRQEIPETESLYMIQCVGSREEDRPYCSRLCCGQALRNAIHLKEQRPEMEITILYREMRSYGYQEDLYRRARKLGINFNRYTKDNKPEVKPQEEALAITYQEPLTSQKISDMADMVVLASAIVPGESNQQLSQMLKTPLNEDNFFLEAHVKLQPVDSATKGVFLAGLAHSPKNISETIAQAQAAAMRAATLLSQEELESTGIVAEVKERVCTGCGVCVELCPYDAREIDTETKVAEVKEILCQGCGACVVGCPGGASRHRGFQKEEIMAMLEATTF